MFSYNILIVEYLREKLQILNNLSIKNLTSPKHQYFISTQQYDVARLLAGYFPFFRAQRSDFG